MVTCSWVVVAAGRWVVGSHVGDRDQLGAVELDQERRLVRLGVGLTLRLEHRGGSSGGAAAAATA